MFRVGFEPMIPVFERAKTVCLRPRGHCDRLKDSWYSGRKSNRVPPEHKSRALSLDQPVRSSTTYRCKICKSQSYILERLRHPSPTHVNSTGPKVTSYRHYDIQHPSSADLILSPSPPLESAYVTPNIDNTRTASGYKMSSGLFLRPPNLSFLLSDAVGVEAIQRQ
jgi:hypothetical protein